MNREKTAEVIILMQAWLDGSEIQWQDEGGKWQDFENKDDINIYDFPPHRIKPAKPREGYIRPNDLHFETDMCHGDCIKVREVI